MLQDNRKIPDDLILSPMYVIKLKIFVNNLLSCFLVMKKNQDIRPARFDILISGKSHFNVLNNKIYGLVGYFLFAAI